MSHVGCVILTMGDRPDELERAVGSVAAQRDVEVDVVVVVNGGPDDLEAEGARTLHLAVNRGIPGGRNVGLEHVEGELILFLDDDAWLASPDTLARAVELFDADPRLGIVSMRLVDPDGGVGQRRHVPRLRVGDPSRSSEVTTFLGGASIVRRDVFHRVGPFPERFFYAHEELDLAWRAIDAGYRVWYEGSLVVHHPSQPASRHAEYHYRTMRNRVLLARRRLPAVLAVLHVGVWFVLMLLRRPDAASVVRGLKDGLVEDAGERAPIRWATVWRMTLVGRPPVI